MPGLLKRILIGRPLASSDRGEHRLGNLPALAVFASDALSSVAYATEEMLMVLMLAGPAFLYLSKFISLAIVALLGIVVVSYRQTIHAYPTGGGAYTVAKENLGVFPSLVAGSALLADYVLTVAVSVAAGVAAITSAFPILYEHRVALAITAVALIMIVNLRGVKESGHIFAPPVYGFILAMTALIVVGLCRYAFSSVPVISFDQQVARLPFAYENLSMLLLVRAFASGCTALTGVEAISNGVTAFRVPEAVNAARVLRWLAFMLAFLFLGTSLVAQFYGVTPLEHDTILSQLGRVIFTFKPAYYFLQITTAGILILAANTSFADFPRLASTMAGDSFLPRQLKHQGDRLVFSNGILLLASFAAALIAFYHADTHDLIPLYAVGVFLSFTISQTGMVFHHLRIKEPNWVRGLIINIVGATATLIVLVAVLVTKFTHGAWIVCLVIPILIGIFYSIRNHYLDAARQLSMDLKVTPRHLKHTVIVPIAGIHRGVAMAIEYGRSLSSNVRAVTVEQDEEATKRLRKQWNKWAPSVELVVLNSPYRELTEPLIKYIKEVDEQDPEDLITVVIPSFIPARWWHHFLHNQSSILLQAALRPMRNVVVTSVRLHLDR